MYIDSNVEVNVIPDPVSNLSFNHPEDISNLTINTERTNTSTSTESSQYITEVVNTHNIEVNNQNI